MNYTKELQKYAKNQIEDSNVLISSETLFEKFQKYAEEVADLKARVHDLKIEGDESLQIAQNTYAKVQETIKNVDNRRGVVGAEYYQTYKLINSYAKKISNMLEPIKKEVNSKITEYKRLEAAQKEAERKKKEEEIAKLAEEKQQERDYINRLESMLIARIFGGEYVTKTGEVKQDPGCHTTEDCKKLINLVNTKWPAPEKFKHFDEFSVARKEKILENINEQMAAIISGNNANKNIRENAIAEAQSATKVMDKVTDSFKKEGQKEAEKEVKEASRGLRKDIRFSVENPDQVDVSFKTVDNQLVKNWLSSNKEKVKQDLKEGKQSLKGIRFYVQERYVNI